MPRMLWVSLASKVSRDWVGEPLPEGCEIYRVSPDGIEESIRSQRPDVLCFDFDRPHRKGLRQVASMLATYPELPAIMLTAESFEGLAIWAFRAGMADYFVKPVASSELLPCLKRLVSGRSVHAASVRRRDLMLPPPLPRAATQAGLHRPRAPRTLPAIRLVEAHYPEKVTSEAAARLCGMDPFQFSRTFKAEYGVAFKTFLMRFRIEKAREFLRQPGSTVGDVAFAVGFPDVSYFARVFKRLAGVPASVYRLTASGDSLTLLASAGGARVGDWGA